MKILTVYTLNSHLLTLKAHNHKKCIFFCRPLIYLKPHDKQREPRSDCSYSVCLPAYVKYTFSDAVILLAF